MTEHRYAIALGSNIGDRLDHLNRALARISLIPGIDVIATSSVYESAGWGRDDLDPFLNSVLAAKGTVAPMDLLKTLLRIEEELGRKRVEKWAPRTIDLDILAVEEMTVREPGLTLPHPWIRHRPFVYLPFAEVGDHSGAWSAMMEPNDEGRAVESDTKRTNLGAPLWGTRSESVTSISVETDSEEQTMDFARSLAQGLSGGEVFAFNAPMGAGKSVFARGIARGLGVTGAVPSPTYTLCRLYETPRGVLEHWDFYRLESEDDLVSAGFFEDDSRHHIRLIEWADAFPFAVQGRLYRTRIEPLSATRRRITISAGDGSLPFPLRVAAHCIQEKTT